METVKTALSVHVIEEGRSWADYISYSIREGWTQMGLAGAHTGGVVIRQASVTEMHAAQLGNSANDATLSLLTVK